MTKTRSVRSAKKSRVARPRRETPTWDRHATDAKCGGGYRVIRKVIRHDD